ncbi:THAP domain-containing protein 5-like isoform X2 [Linepithema humile]|uniref:THAP domain-containing protein 5-like isoform X2 n=1 Tax=Linepithema humile TaxID=83485 RepID=UPI00351DAC15
MRCCVPGCGQESEKEISFHRFPVRDPNRSQLWINKIYAFLEMHNCERGRLKQKKQSVLCSKHFLNSDYLVTASGRMLKISACPSVFSYDPNALKRRNRQSKSSSEIPVSHRLHYIFPKEIGELEGTKVMVTECEEENKKNVSCTQESALEEFMIKKATVKEPMIKESTIEEPILKKAKVEKPMLEDMVEAPMLDQGTVEEPIVEHTQIEESFVEELSKNACTRCLSLEKEVQRLQESIASLEKVVQLQSCSVRDISSPRQEELLQGSNTPTTTTRLAHHDHHYASTPRSLRRKLDFSHAQKIMMEKTARYTMKKFRRSMITVSQLKNLLKSIKEEMIARPEVVDHLEQVFDGSPLQLYKRKAT